MSSAPVSRTINIYIDQASAERSLQSLQKQADKLTKAIETGTKAGKDINSELGKLAAVNEKIAVLNDQISGKLAPTFNQVKTQVQTLRRELDGMSADAPGYAAKFEQFTEVNARFRQMQLEVKGINQALEEGKAKAQSFSERFARFKNEVKTIASGVFIGNLADQAFTAVTEYFMGIVSGASSISDALAKVRQTTGLTEEGVKSLSKELKSIDTRTAQSELLKIAEIGGQFNVPTEQLKGFVEQMDRANVVLGSEFSGGAEQITTELSLLRNVFTDIKSEHIDQDLGKIGNALIVMAQEGAATAPVVSDFSKRLAPLIPTAHLTSGAVLGLGAAMQELAVNPERGGTAMVRLFDKMISNAEAFAKVAGSGIDAFKQKLNTNTFGAFLEVLEGFKKGGDNIIALNSVMAELETEGVGAKEVLVKLSENIDLVKERCETASIALTNTTAITKQFGIMNNNVAAELSKLKKEFNAFIASPGLQTFMGTAVSAGRSLVAILSDVVGFVKDNTVAFGLWTVAVVLNTKAIAGLKTAQLAERAASIANTVTINAEIVATSALGMAKALLTGNITRLRQEWRLMAVAMGTNPLTAFLVIAGAAYVAVNQLVSSTRQLSAAGQNMQEVTRRVNESTAEQISKVQLLSKTLGDELLPLSMRKKALDELISISPEYLDGLSLEAGAYDQNRQLLDQYISSLRAKAEAEAQSSLRADLLKKQLDLQQHYNRAQKEAADAGWLAQTNHKFFGGSFGGGALDDLTRITQEAEQVRQRLADLDAKITQTTQKAATVVNQPANPATTPAVRSIKAIKTELATVTSLWEAAALGSAEYNRLAARRITLSDELSKAEGKQSEHQKQGLRLQQQGEHLAQRRADFDRKLQALAEQAAAASKSRDEAELQNVRNKYSALIGAANKLYKGHKDLAVKTAQLSASEQQELDNLYRKQLDSRSEREYEGTLREISTFYDRQRELAASAYLDGEISLKEHSALMAALEEEEYFSRSVAATDYAASVQKAEADAARYKAESLRKQISNRNNNLNQRAMNGVFEAELDVVNATRGSSAELSAQKALLQAKFDQETQFMDKTSAQYRLKDAELKKQQKAADLNYIQQKIADYAELAAAITNVFSGYMDFMNQGDQQSLERDKAVNDRKKRQLGRQLAAKQISQARYNVEVSKLDEDYDKKKKQLEIKAFNRQKAIQLMNAVINTATGVTGALATPPPWLGVSLAAMIGAAGAIQIAKIASSKPPQYGRGRRPMGNGGIPKGPSHANNGIALVDNNTGAIVGEMEGDEAILSKATVANNAALVNALLDASMYGGGRAIGPDWLYARPGILNYEGLTDTIQSNRLYRNGTATIAADGRLKTDNSLQSVSIDMLPEFIDAMKQFVIQSGRGFKASVYWNEIDEKNRQMGLLRMIGSKIPNSAL